MPVTLQPERASGSARLPVPVATSRTLEPAGSARRAMNSSAAPEMVLATTPKSPAIQVLRMLDLICSMVGMGSSQAFGGVAQPVSQKTVQRRTLPECISASHAAGTDHFCGRILSSTRQPPSALPKSATWFASAKVCIRVMR